MFDKIVKIEIEDLQEKELRVGIEYLNDIDGEILLAFLQAHLQKGNI